MKRVYGQRFTGDQTGRKRLLGGALAASLVALAGCNAPEEADTIVDAPQAGTVTPAADPAPAAPETPAAPAETTGNEIHSDAIYQTYGVHNDGTSPPCANADCTYPRQPGEPENPVWPEYWVADWTMYRVFNDWVNNPPPYPGQPPADLQPGVDYEVSYGRTYYDSTWTGDVPEDGQGAMMEYYQDRCLPIFPFENTYSCAFISLGNTAFFVTYDDRPDWMPPVCLFSSFNHPPRRDFIKHLPYAPNDSRRIGRGGQGYSFWVRHSDGSIMQVGAAPDQTANAGILFGYGFQDQGDGAMPQSFYFSGVPYLTEGGQAVPFAPIVSQNYTTFSAEQPNPADTWDQVNTLDPAALPACQLFDPPSHANAMLGDAEPAPTWGTIGRGGR
ncbi:hypothetical protein [Maricaulis sp.]|uniref:hypothetical protein n=1 Tax=Maricaulis sp. TaxID=1486257 RepID=UPI002618C16F|nr:hypothetical protein [Maricaulis sp.]